MGRLWSGVWGEMQENEEAESVQEGMRELLRNVWVRTTWHLWKPQLVPLLRQPHHPKPTPQMPLIIHPTPNHFPTSLLFYYVRFQATTYYFTSN
ncbi:hypothetical protein LINGRAHAP2_LOCUS8197 [Linum grandiflorum]